MRPASSATVVLFFLACAACNGNVAPPPPYHSTGNAGGPFVPKDGAALFDELGPNSLELIMSDYVGACSMAINSSHVNAGVLSLSAQGGMDPVTTGTFTIDGSTYGATLVRWDGACNRTAADVASGGTITLTAVSRSEVKGTFDLKFPDGELKGDFDAPGCVPPLTDAGT